MSLDGAPVGHDSRNLCTEAVAARRGAGGNVDAAGRMTASTSDDLTLPTHRSRRRFCQRATGLPWDLTFTEAAEKDRDRYNGHDSNKQATQDAATPKAVGGGMRGGSLRA